MFNVGAGEIAVILVLALIVLGPDKLPSAARQAGKYLSEFRRISDGFQRELKDAMDLDGVKDAVKPQSGTMAPVKDVDIAEPLLPEADRVIESDNGPTLPPVMTPTTIPDAPVADAAATNTVEVEGPSSSFG